MDQKAFNERIVMSLLQQCAWVWEHCTANPHEGEFTLTEVMQGFGKQSYKSKTGIVMVVMEKCEYWDVFNSHLQPIDGLTYDRETDEARLEFDDFRYSYLLRDVFRLTASFCKFNCPSMAQKVRFCYKDDERWTEMPEKKAKAVKLAGSEYTVKDDSGRDVVFETYVPKSMSEAKPSPSTGERGEGLTFAELLRQVLLAA